MWGGKEGGRKCGEERMKNNRIDMFTLLSHS